MKSILFLLIISFLIGCFSFIEIKTPQKNISQFEKKLKIDTNKTINFKKIPKCFIENGDSKEKQNSKRYFTFTNDGIQNVGTDILYSNDNQIISLGTWQTKTDSFILSNTDTLIIFFNPFQKQYCHIEYDNTIK